MKQITFFLVIGMLITNVYAQRTLNIHKNDNSVENLSTSKIDSIMFSENENIMLVYSSEEQTSIPIENIDSISISFKEPQFVTTPAAYKTQISNAGTIESVEYTANSGNKTALIYLPYGYNANTKYDILYLMHGAGGNNSTLMGNTSRYTTLKYVIDNLIDRKDIKPLIIVTPTISGMNGAEAFTDELENYLVPAVESKYSTYAKSTNKQDLIQSRKHRAFGGFSMGSTTTWFVILNNLDYFHSFIPMSGDCWALEQMGGVGKPKETAELVANKINEQGYSTNDFFIFAATGTRDIAYEGLTNQINEMKKLTDVFIYDYDSSKGNLYYLVAQNGLHTYDYVTDYLFDILPYIFSR